MAYIIGFIIAAVSVALVATPFFRQRGKSKEPEVLTARVEAQDKRRRIYQEMDTIQLDYDMGNIDEAQYQQQIQSYRLEAASLIREQQKHGQKITGTALEEEIKAFRSARASGKPLDTCPNCGFITSQGEKLCPLCSHNLVNEQGTKDESS